MQYLGHTYTEKLPVVYLKCSRNWPSCILYGDLHRKGWFVVRALFQAGMKPPPSSLHPQSLMPFPLIASNE